MITIINCGYDSSHRTQLDIHRPEGSGNYTLLFIKSDAFFEKNGIYLDIVPNTVILYGKDDYVHYGCREPHFNDDWIHFDITEEDLLFFNKLEIPRNTPCPLSYSGQLSEYTRLIVLEKHSEHLSQDKILDSLMRALLYSLASQIHAAPDQKKSHKYYNSMNQLRVAVLNTPYKKWSVEDMAGQIALSPSYFQHLYKELFGTSCIQDVIQARLKNACFYLRTTDMPIHALSGFCGYDNELHFIRQFKRYLRMTPSKYREHYQIR